MKMLNVTRHPFFLLLGLACCNVEDTGEVGDPVDVESTVDLGAAAQALNPPATIVNIESDSQFGNVTSPGGTVYFARTAPREAGAPHEWWLRTDVLIKNNSATATLSLTGFEVDTNVTSPEDRPLDAPVSIPPGQSRVVVVPSGVVGASTMPTVFGIRAKFAGYTGFAEKVVSVEAFESNTLSGGSRFPFKLADLPNGVYLSVGAHANNVIQKYALDIGARRWNTTTDSWDGLTAAGRLHPAPGSLNSHYLVWDLPVYAIAPGNIVRCHRSILDHTPSGSGTGGGNTIIIDHGNGEYTSYHHLKQNSVPAALCPIEGNVGSDWFPISVPVSAGQLIGRVGNTGQSSGPHLHFQITGEAPQPSDDTVRSLPANFYDVRVHRSDGFDPTAPGATAFYQIPPTDPAALYSNMLIRPIL